MSIKQLGCTNPINFMLYTGDRSDTCAISFAPLSDIEQPVGFDSAHAFECECIVEWLTKHRSSNPMTGECIPPRTPIASLLRPLIVIEGVHVPKTQEILDRAGCTICGDTNPVNTVGWREKLGWDAVFAVLFATANCYCLDKTVIHAALLVCSMCMICAQYNSTGRCFALVFVLWFTVAGWNQTKFVDDAAVIRFIVSLVFTTKLSLDFTMTFAAAVGHT